MPFGIEAGKAALNVGSGLLGSAFGLFTAGINDRRQIRQQEKLNELAYQTNNKMAEMDYKRQIRLWNATNYDAQKEQLEKAGLNPGLLYGMSGGGGATTNAASGQGVSTGQAPQGGGEIMGMMQQSMQMRMMEAQVKVMESQADKNRAEAAKTSGIDTELGKTQIQSLTQGIENAKAQQELTKIQSRMQNIQATIAEDTKFEATESAMANFRRSEHELEILLNEEAISDATYNDKIKIIAEESLRMMLSNKQIQAQTQLTEAQTKSIPVQLSIENFSREIQANYPGLFNVLGKQINDLISSITERAGGGKTNEHRTEKRN